MNEAIKFIELKSKQNNEEIQTLLKSKNKDIEAIEYLYSLVGDQYKYINVIELLKNSAKGEKKLIKTTQSFITILDAIKIDYKTVEQLFFILTNLIDNIKQCEFNDYEKLKEWHVKLTNMKVEEELNKDELKQFSFDIENCYNNFYKSFN